MPATVRELGILLSARVPGHSQQGRGRGCQHRQSGPATLAQCDLGLPAIACDCLSVIAFRTLRQQNSRLWMFYMLRVCF